MLRAIRLAKKGHTHIYLTLYIHDIRLINMNRNGFLQVFHETKYISKEEQVRYLILDCI
jgi:hypothetical protein